MRFKSKPRVESFLIHLLTELLNNVCAGFAKGLIPATSDKAILFQQPICSVLKSDMRLSCCDVSNRLLDFNNGSCWSCHDKTDAYWTLRPPRRRETFWNETMFSRFNRNKLFDR